MGCPARNASPSDYRHGIIQKNPANRGTSGTERARGMRKTLAFRRGEAKTRVPASGTRLFRDETKERNPAISRV